MLLAYSATAYVAYSPRFITDYHGFHCMAFFFGSFENQVGKKDKQLEFTFEKFNLAVIK